jgi:hypothetical protein
MYSSLQFSSLLLIFVPTTAVAMRPIVRALAAIRAAMDTAKGATLTRTINTFAGYDKP